MNLDSLRSMTTIDEIDMTIVTVDGACNNYRFKGTLHEALESIKPQSYVTVTLGSMMHVINTNHIVRAIFPVDEP